MWHGIRLGIKMVALDAMGGDFSPQAAAEGAIAAAKQGVPVCLFGNELQLIPLLYTIDPAWDSYELSLVHCNEVIGMGHEPGKSVLRKKKSSLVKAMQSVADGVAQSVVSAGNSGAVLVAGTLILGRAPSVMRPAIGDFIPTNNDSIFCIDLGATTDSKAAYLEQFAQMGHVYVQMVKNIKNPRIALLSNGSEPYKGSQLVKQAYELLDRSGLNFVGNIESRDVFSNKTDILVCDGFTGNILLKALEGTAGALMQWLKQEAARSVLCKAYLYLGSTLLNRLKNKVDYLKNGGALLLGLNHPVIIAHGCANGKAIERALIFAHQIGVENFVSLFNVQVASLAAKKRGVSVVVSQKLRSIFRFRQQ